MVDDNKSQTLGEKLLSYWPIGLLAVIVTCIITFAELKKSVGEILPPAEPETEEKQIDINPAWNVTLHKYTFSDASGVHEMEPYLGADNPDWCRVEGKIYLEVENKQDKAILKASVTFYARDFEMRNGEAGASGMRNSGFDNTIVELATFEIASGRKAELKGNYPDTISGDIKWSNRTYNGSGNSGDSIQITGNILKSIVYDPVTRSLNLSFKTPVAIVLRRKKP